MASPQVEDGYTRIASELLDAIILFDFSKRQAKVLLAIIRRTYGFNKKSDDITVTRLAQYTGLARSNVSATLDELVAVGAVSKRDGTFGYVVEVVKDYTKWQAYQNDTRIKTRHVSKQDASQIDTPPVSNQDGERIETIQVPSQIDTHNRQSFIDNPNRQSTIDSSEGPKEPSVHGPLVLDGNPPEPTLKPAKADKPPKAPKAKKPPKEPPPTRATWAAYSEAYLKRYGVDPLGNATVNGQLANFVNRVGQAESPEVAAFYVRHQNSFYVQTMHQVGFLLRDAEKLRTEWLTNRTMTQTQARQTDKTASNVFARMHAELEAQSSQGAVP